MKKTLRMARLIALISLLNCSGSWAQNVVISNSPQMNNAQMTRLIQALRQVIAEDGGYSGLNSSGQECGFRTDEIDGFNFISGFKLYLTNPISEAEYWLDEFSLHKSPDGQEQELHLAIRSYLEETEPNLTVLDIFSQKGVPQSFQIAVAYRNMFYPGEVFTPSDFLINPVCSKLKKQ